MDLVYSVQRREYGSQDGWETVREFSTWGAREKYLLTCRNVETYYVQEGVQKSPKWEFRPLTEALSPVE